MMADQRKNATATVSWSYAKQSKAKRKKSGLPHYDLDVRSNISLEWDDKRRSVVAKREQIGISQRHLIPFVDVRPGSNILGDVITIPREVFEVKLLIEVLSYEVWQTHLSKNEQDLLMQFLPQGVDLEPHEVVQDLFAGENFHFGNPFEKWSASLCSGNLHPDAVLKGEQYFKSNKRTYYAELQEYHTNMIRNLQMWKEKWASCTDPEEELGQKIWRSRKYADKSMPTNANEPSCDPDEYLVAMSESGSWGADEKLFSNDYQNIMMMHQEHQKRKGHVDGKYDITSDELKVVARPRRGEKLQKRNILRGDGAEYMAYIKVSKEQHRLVKSSMKHLSSSIKQRSLNNVLGNINRFNVQPFEVFEKEEEQKLHDHWLKLANKDLPAGFARWTRKQLQKQEFMKCLEQAMKQKLKSLNEDGHGEVVSFTRGIQSELKNVEEANFKPVMEVETSEEDKLDIMLQEQMDIVETDSEPAIASQSGQDEEEDSLSQSVEEQACNETGNHKPSLESKEVLPGCSQNHCLQQITLRTCSSQLHDMDLDSEDNPAIARTDDISPRAENFDHVHVPVSLGDQGVSLPSSDVWPALSVPASYYYSTTGLSNVYACGNTYARDLSLKQQPEVIEQRPMRLINLESHMDAGKDMLQNGSNNMRFFTSDDRSELLQSFFNLPFHQEQKQTGLDFHPTASVMMGASQFSGQLEEQRHHLSMPPLEVRQKRLNDLYMHQNVPENIYSDGFRYPVPSRENFSPVNVQDWGGNTARIPQSHLNQTWFSQAAAAAAAAGNRSTIGSRTNAAADETLFSVLSECNKRCSYDPLGASQSENYGGVPTSSDFVPPTPFGNNYMSGHEVPSGLKTNSSSIRWMNLTPQNSTSLQDSIGNKAFLRSWNP